MQIFKKEMKLKGYSATKLSEEIGVSKQIISAWISGKSTPYAETVTKLKEIGFSDTAVLEPSKDVEV